MRSLSLALLTMFMAQLAMGSICSGDCTSKVEVSSSHEAAKSDCHSEHGSKKETKNSNPKKGCCGDSHCLIGKSAEAQAEFVKVTPDDLRIALAQSSSPIVAILPTHERDYGWNGYQYPPPNPVPLYLRIKRLLN